MKPPCGPWRLWCAWLIALRALNALGLALASYGHKWSASERFLYEAAVGELTFSDGYMDSDSSASEKCPRMKPSYKRTRATGPSLFRSRALAYSGRRAP